KKECFEAYVDAKMEGFIENKNIIRIINNNKYNNLYCYMYFVIFFPNIIRYFSCQEKILSFANANNHCKTGRHNAFIP
ncbi:MAG: hypothetical protein PVH74_06575, partial [Desulfobacterales bacterium]